MERNENNIKNWHGFSWTSESCCEFVCGKSWSVPYYSLLFYYYACVPYYACPLLRVATRVAQGGHNVLEEVIRRRFAHGIRNFERYKLLVDGWQLYDNSDAPAILIEEGQSK